MNCVQNWPKCHLTGSGAGGLDRRFQRGDTSTYLTVGDHCPWLQEPWPPPVLNVAFTLRCNNQKVKKFLEGAKKSSLTSANVAIEGCYVCHA